MQSVASVSLDGIRKEQKKEKQTNDSNTNKYV